MKDEEKLQEILGKIEIEYLQMQDIDAFDAMQSLNKEIEGVDVAEQIKIADNILQILWMVKNGVPSSPEKLDYLGKYANAGVLASAQATDAENIARMGLEHPKNWEPFIEIYKIKKNLLPDSIKNKIEGIMRG